METLSNCNEENTAGVKKHDVSPVSSVSNPVLKNLKATFQLEFSVKNLQWVTLAMVAEAGGVTSVIGRHVRDIHNYFQGTTAVICTCFACTCRIQELWLSYWWIYKDEYCMWHQEEMQSDETMDD